MAGTNGLRQFLILLYKGLLLRKRHYFMTFTEIVIPIIIACIPAMIVSESSYPQNVRSDRMQDKSAWISYSTYEPFDPFTIYQRRNKSVEFVYTPPNDITDKFMNDSVGMFAAKVYGYRYKNDFISNSVTTEKELEIYCISKQKKNPSITVIGTVFNNFNDKLPASLDYKLRFSNGYYSVDFKTQMKYWMNGYPNYYNAYTDSFFLGWQACVEQTFINKKMEEQGKNIDYHVWMQKFPYPEHRSDSSSVNIINIVSWCIAYGLLFFVMNIVRRVIEEKANGSKELLKMMGMTDFTYWTSTFANYFTVGFIIFLIITIVFKAPLKNKIIYLEHSNFMLVLIIHLLFIASLILFCMAFSVFFNRAIFAIIAMLVIYILSFTLLMVQFFFMDKSLNFMAISVAAKLTMCLLPTGSLLTVYHLIDRYEGMEKGIQWNNLTEYLIYSDLNLLMVIMMMFFSCILYVIFIWYFDAVWPWQPGVPKPFYFFLMKSYWFGAEPEKEYDIFKNESSSDFFEMEPNMTIGVMVKNLSKEFRTGLVSKLAVNNVSLNIYEGQITALLGHNGAGKTTTINILTGLYTPTSGTASINGRDILRQTTAARRGLGVCPQHNVLYDTLTVEEHLKIYAAMKGVPWRQLTSEATQVLNILKLTDKRNELVKTLSGGMKRKLSLAIAIVGGSKVLFLDEPTSGMDVEARRSVWDALLEIRHNRTIILTTHYMEEADILGDRIAIMAEGEIQCCGSPMFLKQKFGTGYHLHVVKHNNFNLDGLSNLLKKYIPEASLDNELEKEISFSLSTDTGSGFGEMFEELEKQKEKLGVLSFGITITTMEDVFLNVANISDIKYRIRSNSGKQNGANIEFEDVYGDFTSFKPHPRIINQFLGLFMKCFHYSKRHWSVVSTQFAMPFLLMCLCIYLSVYIAGSSNSSYDPLKLDISSVYGKTDGFYYSNKPQLSKLADNLKNVFESNQISAEEVPEATHYVLKYGKDNFVKYLKNLIVGGAIDQYSNKTLNLTAWYNGQPYHSTPMALSLMHSALLQNITNDGSISLTNAPIPKARFYDDSSTTKIMAAIFAPLSFAFLSAGFILLPIHERATKAKLLQLMSGVPTAIYWMAMFLWDFLVHFVICISLIIPFAIFAHYAFFGVNSNAIGMSFLLMLLYGWASIPFGYVFSFLFKKGSAGYTVIVGLCAMIGVGCGSSLIAVLLNSTSEDNKMVQKINPFIWILRTFFPTFSLSYGFGNLFGIAFQNSFCDSFPSTELDLYCSLPTMDERDTLFKCCKKICKDKCLIKSSFLSWDMHACGRDALFLCIHGFLFFGLVLLFETKIMSALLRIIRLRWRQMRHRNLQIIQENVIEDSDVLQEEERVRSLIPTQTGSGREALVVSELTKLYKNFYAVDRLAFGIHEQECFGLLGVNGAGKTTTFRMLTGDCYPSAGNAFIQNNSLMMNLKKFQSYLGYCPQFDALLDLLTGREMLTLFGQLRGLTSFDLKEKVEKLIKMTDLTKHADKQSRFYSGGNKRKLSVAIALIGAPPLILLDEPTAGVDPVSRRKIWNILAQARRNTGAAIILTTHSMEESEALCNRLAIMVNGRFRCLGSIQHLKSKYGQGYTLIIKMKREDQENQDRINTIKCNVQSKLPGANLKDDHQGMLQYHIVDPSVTLSRLFKFMSQMKVQFELEDYLISDTSLEQIFLTFARAQRASE
ncbi:ATP-binding cassette sub-family A member 2-like isoform X2 [Argiope bruennichi]|nr:ATP-binding cassette sub-family A member 2-like isoform X2 [Argiope bruennichi]XP_055935357.1 ATP-binding cassette sub-family A member 2-like isoform X2 [Argiope bruennichi]XP_055935358.1 ATP-binding cassette sub-family A member 2-like isoform X2 [Argiope bruennichi]XP_055935359.1 ATP-binding cassette sub-family A member 2-like isoform X2 [Argiope bruennichi]